MRRPPPRATLERIYRRARYRVYFADETIELEVGRRSPELERRLAAAQIPAWGLLTAVNPRSRPLAPRTNRDRLRRLELRLAERPWAIWPAAGVDPEGEWPDEPSYFVAGATDAELVSLAAELGQAAILAGEAGGAPRLIFVD